MNNDITFSIQFWKKIQEEMRMYVIVERKPKKQLKLYELHDEDMNIDLQQVQQWSDDNSKLYYLIKENGFADFICNKESIIENYTQLIFDRQGICQMDQELIKFNNLTLLRLNDNQIKIVENIPINLKELHLYTNPITHLSPKLRSEQLLFLGLGYCQLDDTMIEKIQQKFPNLKALDLTHNLLIDLECTVENLKMLTSLKILSLYGNSFVLLPHYQQYVVSSMINLKYLDEVSTKSINDRLQDEENQKLAIIQAEQKKIIEEQQKAEQELAKLQEKNKKTGKGAQAPAPAPIREKEIVKQEDINQDRIHTQPSKYNVGEEGELRFQEKDQNIFRFTLKIQTIEGLEGLIFDRQQYPEAEQYPKLYQSTYWLSYKFLDQEVNTENSKILYENCVIENEKGRLDFQHVFEISLRPSVQIRDFIERGLLIQVYQQQPTVIQNEEGVVLDFDQDGMPKYEKKILGICLIEMDWLRGVNQFIQQKYKLFKQETSSYPEYWYPLEKEQVEFIQFNNVQKKELIFGRMEFIKKQIQLEDDQKKEKQLQISNESKKELTKFGKGKDNKKKDDKVAPNKKGKDSELDKKPVEQLDWPIHQRQYVYINETNIIRAQQILLAVSLKISN